ncbi:MAG: MBOAT family protein [Gammaproteobacteria bacterium]|nr:MBOAT family protein [Gammaproteobacteria bacterium]
MLFNSFIFWIFFLIIIVAYRYLPHQGQNRLLLAGSYIFYGYWDYRYLSLIFISTIIDYFVATGIYNSSEQQQKKRILLISICANLGMLGFFKYYNFFAVEMSELLLLIGLPVPIKTLNIVLPVGISFYTFQTMSYTIDVYRGKTVPTSRFLDFALYVSFFPQLVAGPIERSYNLLPQILEKRPQLKENLVEGIYHICIGMFKKVVIADNMAPIVNSVFSRPVSDLSGPEIMVGIYAFAFQIYGDFSGYSSIAQGIAKLMGFNLSWNFKMPYFASNPSDFWQRWHITLSAWLRDYLYVPLGGNRLGKLLTLRNLMLTMLLGGLWHGAGWTFIAWGFYHGLLLIAYRVFEFKQQGVARKLMEHRVGKGLRIIFFFHLICFSWLLFRADSIDQVWAMMGVLVTNFEITNFVYYASGMLIFFAAPLVALEYWIEKSGDLLKVVNSHWLVRASIYSYFAVMLWVFPPLTNQVFIYFQF